ncbi:ribbon-helix-helix protein, CopG family [Mesorhizobium sp.]|uniref:ribbon-helix-helix protein, CopG family n=1 Tax=Mesorhizobium sp. TaxID=1871066 RepID=UPI000FE5230B|nr:MAG: ribbon-helix-helix protein, CopG family [Mesorhizobium sp.]
MKSIDETKKPKKGRPRADTEAVNLRLPRDMLAALDVFRRSQDELPNRPEAIRILLRDHLIALGYLDSTWK